MPLRRFFEPTNIVYFLAHLVLFIIGLYLFQQNSHLWQSVGASLVAAGITGWVVFVYVFAGQSTRARLTVIQQLGVVAGFTHRGAAIREEYRTRVNVARRQIDILGFGLSSLREDFAEEFASWKQKAKVRILLLDPEFPIPDHAYADQRDLEEHSPEHTVANEVRHFVEQSRGLVDDRFSIRLYRCLPAVNIFRVDNELFWGPYLMGTASRNSPTLVVTSQGDLFQPFTEHFDEIWDKHSHDPYSPAPQRRTPRNK